MNKPTPGPWAVGCGLRIQACDVGPMFEPTTHGTHKQMNANAALIVAAVNACFAVSPENPLAVAEALPEVVEALRGLVSEFDNNNALAAAYDDGMDEDTAEMLKARVALAALGVKS